LLLLLLLLVVVLLVVVVLLLKLLLLLLLVFSSLVSLDATVQDRGKASALAGATGSRSGREGARHGIGEGRGEGERGFALVIRGGGEEGRDEVARVRLDLPLLPSSLLPSFVGSQG
jgi:hypothetical protein